MVVSLKGFVAKTFPIPLLDSIQGAGDFNTEPNAIAFQVLNASSNMLTSFPVEGYGALEVLDLSRNKLTTVPDGLTGLQTPALRWLSLDNNPMRQVRFPIAGKEEQDGEIFVNLTWVSVSHIKELQELEPGAFSGKVVSHRGYSFGVSRVEAGSNTSTVALRVVGGDETGTQCLGVELGHPVPGGYKYGDLTLQFWRVSNLRQ
jgi:hypothetical protein